MQNGCMRINGELTSEADNDEDFLQQIILAAKSDIYRTISNVNKFLSWKSLF